MKIIIIWHRVEIYLSCLYWKIYYILSQILIPMHFLCIKLVISNQRGALSLKFKQSKLTNSLCFLWQRIVKLVTGR